MKRFLTKLELKEATGLSLPSINRGLATGRIPSTKLGARVLIPATFVDQLETEARNSVQPNEAS